MRLRRSILWAKLVLGVLEVLFGVALLVPGLGHIDLGHTLTQRALHELQQDPGDLIARWVLAAAKSLRPSFEVKAGLVLVVYGLVKVGLLVGVLRGHRRIVFAGALVFSAIAAVGFVVLLLHPTFVRIVLGGLDIAVASVLVAEVRHVLTSHGGSRVEPS